jgi:CRISPR-associated protein Cas5d
MARRKSIQMLYSARKNMKDVFKSREFEFTVYGNLALFSDPVTKLGGEKFSYPFPTYEAIKRITAAIYWKPTIIWKVDEVRIMNRIANRSVPVRTMKMDNAGSAGISYYNYLTNVRYNVRVHFEWNLNRPDLAEDRIAAKHEEIFRKALRRGGRRNIFLGASECAAYVEPCVFEDGTSFYDGVESLSTGTKMFHSYVYADEAFSDETAGKVTKLLWVPVMKNGIIDFPDPSDCETMVTVSDQRFIKVFSKSGNHYEKAEDFYKKAGRFCGRTATGQKQTDCKKHKAVRKGGAKR